MNRIRSTRRPPRWSLAPKLDHSLPRDAATRSRPSLRAAADGLLELGEVPPDHPDVESRQDQLLGLSLQEEPEAALDELLGRVGLRAQPHVDLVRQPHIVNALRAGVGQRDPEREAL